MYEEVEKLEALNVNIKIAMKDEAKDIAEYCRKAYNKSKKKVVYDSLQLAHKCIINSIYGSAKIVMKDEWLCLDNVEIIMDEFGFNIIELLEMVETSALQSNSHEEYRARAPGASVPVPNGVTNEYTFLLYRS